MELWDVLDGNRVKTGKIHIKGEASAPGEYHLVVYAWIRNNQNMYLIQKRASIRKVFPNIWTCSVGGSALKGETSIQAIMRETKEELGIDLNEETGVLLHSKKMDSFFADIWMFEHDISVEELILQTEEVDDAMWASIEKMDEIEYSGAAEPPVR